MIPAKHMPSTAARAGGTARCTVSLAVAFLAITSLLADDRFEKSATAVFPQPEEGKALVFLLRPHWEPFGGSPPLELYGASQIWGYLPTRSYIAVQFEPGSQRFLVVGTSITLFGSRFEGLVLSLEAGHTYVLELKETHNAYGIVKSKWKELDPSELGKRVQEKSLQHVTLTAKGREALEAARKKRFSAPENP